MTPEQIDRAATTIRELNKQESDLLNQRMGWLVQTQSLLFAALAFTWEKSAALAYVLYGLGIAVAVRRETTYGSGRERPASRLPGSRTFKALSSFTQSSVMLARLMSCS